MLFGAISLGLAMAFGRSVNYGFESPNLFEFPAARTPVQRVYGEDGIKVFDIECDMDDFKTITRYPASDLFIPANLTYDGRVWKNVKLRLRGDSSRDLEKKSMKIVFRKDEPFVEDLNSINLNAEWLDETLMRQYLATRLYKASGTPCFSSELVVVNMNGLFLGLFLQVESVNKKFLKRHELSKKGSLYKAKRDGASLSSYDEVYYHWEKKTNEDDPGREDLKQLIDHLHDLPVDGYYEACQDIFDYDQMINVLAVNMLLANTSTYYHNYYIYNNPDTKRWQMFPWDMDQTFSKDRVKLPYQRGNSSDRKNALLAVNPFFERAISDTNILEDIRARIVVLSDSIFNPEFTDPIIDSLVTVIEPYISQDTNFRTLSVEEWRTEVEKVRYFIANRSDSLLYQIDQAPMSFKIFRPDRDGDKPVILRWRKAHDPDGDSLTYTLKWCKERDFNDATTTTITGIKDTIYPFVGRFTPGKIYVKVYADDGEFEVPGFDNRVSVRFK